METVFKLAITAVVLCAVYYQLLLIRTVWRSQIDPRATITRLLKKLEPENTLMINTHSFQASLTAISGGRSFSR